MPRHPKRCTVPHLPAPVDVPSRAEWCYPCPQGQRDPERCSLSINLGINFRFTSVSVGNYNYLGFFFLQVFYKDDLNWMKGIGCYAWDTPEIVRAKKSYELQSDVSSTYITHIFFMFIFACSNLIVFLFFFTVLNRSSTRQRARRSLITTLLWQTLLCMWLLYWATLGPVR